MNGLNNMPSYPISNSEERMHAVVLDQITCLSKKKMLETSLKMPVRALVVNSFLRHPSAAEFPHEHRQSMSGS